VGELHAASVRSAPAAGGSAYLRISLRLPAGAAADQQGRSLRMRYRFTIA